MEHNDVFILARKKHDAERSKKYRETLKSRKQYYKLESLQSKEVFLQSMFVKIKEEIDHRHNTNCEELNHSEFQMQTTEIQPSKNNETQQVISPRFQPVQALLEEHDECSMSNASLNYGTNIASEDVRDYNIKEEVMEDSIDDDSLTFEDIEVKIEEHPVVDTNAINGTAEFVAATSDNLPKVNMFAIVKLFAMKPSYRLLDFTNIKQEICDNYGDVSIGFVQVHKNNTKCTIQGKVAFNKTESHVCVVKYEDKDKIIEYTSCDCQNSACVHMIIFLMWLHRRSEERIDTNIYYNISPEIQQKQFVISSKEQFSDSNTNSETQPTNNNQVLKKYFAVCKDKILILAPLKNSCPKNTSSKLSLHILLSKAEELNIKYADDFIEYCRSNVSEQDCIKAAQKTAFNKEEQQELEYGRIVEDLVYDVSEATSDDVEQLVTKILKPGVKEKDIFLNHVIDIVKKTLNVEITRCGVLVLEKYPIFCGSPYGVTDEHVIDVAYIKDDETIEVYIKNNRLSTKIKARLLLLMFLAKKQKAYFILRNKNFKTCKQVIIHEFSFNIQNCMNLIFKCTKFWKENVFKRGLCKV